MALTIGSGGGVAGVFYGDHRMNHSHNQHSNRPQLLPTLSSRTLHVASASKKFTPRTKRLENRNRKGSISTKDEDEEEDDDDIETRTVQIGNTASKFGSDFVRIDGNGSAANNANFDLSTLPGLEKDFFEGSQWDAFGFFGQYMWAFGIVFALVACVIAVSTYNEGATDFKKTPVYKESIQSRELLEEQEGSDSEVFESNPTEVAPSLE